MTGDLERLERATAALEAPFALLDLDAYWHNARDLLRRAAGRPIRIATKSVRCRSLLADTLAFDPGFQGLLCFTLPEALWLAAEGFDDLVVAYPTADAAALRELSASMAARPGARITVMVDDPAHLDLIARCVADAGGGPVRACIDLDAGWRPLGPRFAIGARRSPLHEPADAAHLARLAARIPESVRIVGLMAYEAQIAGVADRPAGRPVYGAVLRAVQARSARELARRRAAAVAAVREVAELEFVNGGGTGSVERTASEAAVTEIAAGSGLFAPALFDRYSSFTPRPAAFFALPVVRRPGPGVATLLGGGYVASGAAGRDRLPVPWLPRGLELDGTEGAGEVQTPVRGAAADGLEIGDRVWMRHAKAGELCERFDALELLSGDVLAGRAATYRGEGRCFL